jgi:hypothetical protein
MYTAEDILGAYRLRRQVELAIKRVKSLIHTDEQPTHTPEASRIWLLSDLLLAALTEDMTGISWTPSPGDLTEFDPLSLLWRINRMVLTALLAAVIGPITPSLLLIRRRDNASQTGQHTTKTKTRGDLSADQPILTPMGEAPSDSQRHASYVPLIAREVQWRGNGFDQPSRCGMTSSPRRRLTSPARLPQ